MANGYATDKAKENVMDTQVLISLIAPVLIASIGLLGPIIKTLLDRKKPEAEAAAIYDSIQVANAKEAQVTITELRTEIHRLRKLLRKYGHNPDESDTGPIQVPGGTK